MSYAPTEIVTNSSGKPPAAHTPRFTASATARRWTLQLFNSLQELQIPITGRPEKALGEKPSARSAARCWKPMPLSGSNHFALRSFLAMGPFSLTDFYFASQEIENRNPLRRQYKSWRNSVNAR